MALLDKVASPADLKAMSDAELGRLADEVRGEVISVVSKTGGLQRVETATAQRVEEPNAQVVREANRGEIELLDQVVEREEVDERKVAEHVDDRASRLRISHRIGPSWVDGDVAKETIVQRGKKRVRAMTDKGAGAHGILLSKGAACGQPLGRACTRSARPEVTAFDVRKDCDFPGHRR